MGLNLKFWKKKEKAPPEEPKKVEVDARVLILFGDLHGGTGVMNPSKEMAPILSEGLSKIPTFPSEVKGIRYKPIGVLFEAEAEPVKETENKS